jgi:cytosylglucuronate decarboxylase
MKPEYLFIRILEACNAGCFMCGYRLSEDTYRFDADSMRKVLRTAKEEGFRFLRITGGEPLMHPEILQFLKDVSEYGIQSSVITNGYFLSAFAERLSAAGLKQVVVSIDGSSSVTHDRYRATPGLFDRCIQGLSLCREYGILCRVNTVCGPHNFREMPDLQTIISEVGVTHWELSALKLAGAVKYKEPDLTAMDEIVDKIYTPRFGRSVIIPMGKPWCGATKDERELYVRAGIPPRPDNECWAVHKIRYIDAKNGRIFPCSLLPHRGGVEQTADTMEPGRTLTSKKVEDIIQYYQEKGPTVCTGCSATAAGYSNALVETPELPDWSY